LVRQVAYYGASLALAAVVPTLVRALSQRLSPPTRVPRRNGRGTAGNGRGVLVAAAVGAVIGAGAAFLLAPATGRESREWLVRRTRDLEGLVDGAFERSEDVVSNGVIPS
jgi:hypothetical protein